MSSATNWAPDRSCRRSATSPSSWASPARPSRRRWSPSRCWASTVLRSLREHRARLPEIVEARLGLELQIVELAAERRTEADLQRIDEALAFMRAEIDKGGRGERGDELFHRALTDAAHNSVLSQLMAFIGEMVLESRIESLGQEGRPEASLTAHRRIADAVRAGDPEAAVEEMRAHIRKVSDVELLKDEATA
jgi:GntR family transcriptional regulator, transcriptional repressor for pyruvate dehydrogenase complex